MANSGRTRQRYRTRKALLAAAARLLKDGQQPSMEAVAEAALVSRATAYRYFSSVEALLIEAPIDFAAPDPQTLFFDDASTDPIERLDRAEAIMHEMVYANELALRHMLSKTLVARAQRGRGDVPVRQNRRVPLIEAALAPAQDSFDQPSYERLCAALALVFGPESMIVFRDVLPVSPRRARAIKRWMLRALVEAAKAESAGARRDGP